MSALRGLLVVIVAASLAVPLGYCAAEVWGAWGLLLTLPAGVLIALGAWEVAEHL